MEATESIDLKISVMFAGSEYGGWFLHPNPVNGKVGAVQ